MKAKPLSYGRQCIENDDIQAVIKVLKSGWLTQGPSVESFENALSDYCGAKYAVAVTNGTVALHLACLAAGVGPDDEGITTPITFAASANGLLYCGAKPVLADIMPGTWNIDPLEIRKKITNKTKVIIPVDFAGLPCDLEEIRAIADENGLLVIEDGCHALGASYKGEKVGSCKYSDMTVFSFHPVKPITTGEGGAILTNNPDLAEKLRMLRHHGITKDPAKMSRNEGPWYHEIQMLGYNGRITDIQCVLGESQLKKLDRFTKRKEEIAAVYRSEFNKIKGLDIQIIPDDRTNAYHLFVINLDPDMYDRKAVFEGLIEKDIFPQVHYIPLHLQPLFQKILGVKEGDYPEAERYYAGAISIPMFPSLEDEDVQRVIESIQVVLEQRCL